MNREHTMHGAIKKRPLLVRFPGAEPARIHLVCAAHAGAGAAPFSRWAECLPPWVSLIAIRLPGRESRLREAPMTSLDAAAEEVARELEVQQGPLAFFGHCFGAVLAYRAARLMEQTGRDDILRVIAAAAPAPDRTVGGDTHRLSGAALFEQLTRYGAVQDTSQGRALFALSESAICADFQALETWRPVDTTALPLAAPVLEVRGDADRVLEPGTAGWSLWTTSEHRRLTVPGPHFLLGDSVGDLLDVIAQQLEEDLIREQLRPATGPHPVSSSTTPRSGGI
ncbi:thioesterase domain-containing protein [Streptomyces sp. CoT10]|uniref:thioesterase II family protein n=1 Tax=Streptomyces sp. CoT10 TaxID=2875762 RepID=UPI0027E01615|nr:thioesterase domain-containing protein [Streptomyces sp. CoT10]